MFGKIRQSEKQEKKVEKQRPRDDQPEEKIKAPITHKIHKYKPSGNSNMQNQLNNQYKHQHRNNQHQHQQHRHQQKQHPSKPTKPSHSPSLNDRSLKGSQFRLLNQILYTQSSHDAIQYFSQNPTYCNTYHEGFREQTLSWQVNPLDLIIKMLLTQRSNLSTKKIIDLGCGQGKLQQSIQHTGCKIRSYDIMQLKPFIIKVDISHLPLKSDTQDIAIFCLSLMGVNYVEFLEEALRVLKIGGEMIVAEVESRCKEWKQFEEMVVGMGARVKEVRREKYFRVMVFEKMKGKKESKGKGKQETIERGKEVLSPCIYKRR